MMSMFDCKFQKQSISKKSARLFDDGDVCDAAIWRHFKSVWVKQQLLCHKWIMRWTFINQHLTFVCKICDNFSKQTLFKVQNYFVLNMYCYIDILKINDRLFLQDIRIGDVGLEERNKIIDSRLNLITFLITFIVLSRIFLFVQVRVELN